MTLNSPEANVCVTLDEAARQLSKARGQTITEADVLALALNGHFQLSVFLPDTVADCWESEDVPEGNSPDYFADIEQNAIDVETDFIRGLWDLPLVHPGELDVRRLYNKLRGLPPPPLPTQQLPGMLVEKPGVLCRLHMPTLTTSATSGISPENKFVIRTDRLAQVIAALAVGDTASTLDDDELSTKERRSLYIIIATLAKISNTNILKSSKIGLQIETAAAELGLKIHENNVADKLKKVIEALDLEDKFP